MYIGYKYLPVFRQEKSILLLSLRNIYETLDRLSIEIIVRYYDPPRMFKYLSIDIRALFPLIFFGPLAMQNSS